MDYSALTPEQVLRELAASPNGLTAAEAAQRLATYGPNELHDQVKIPLWRRALEPFKSLFVLVLVVAVGLSVLSGELLDAGVIAVVLVVNAVIYYTQEYSANRVLATLKTHDKRLVQVLRDEQPVTAEAVHLVPGDIVLVSEGMKVPADGRLLEANRLQVDESMLTGESLPQTKTTATLPAGRPLYEQTNRLFSGTLVRSGTGEYVVTGTGEQTELGRIAELSSSKLETSPLQRQIDRMTTRVIVAVGAVLLLTFGLTTYRGIALEEALRFLLSLAVAAVPEGLPVALTLVLLLSARRLVRRKALVRRLSAIETLGQVQLVATDKTGTITLNELRIEHYWPYQMDETDFHQVIRQSLAVLRGHSDDPLEVAIRDTLPARPDQGELVATLPFEQAARMSGAIWQAGRGRRLYVKGAPEAVIAVSDLTAAERKHIHAEILKLSAQGYRLIAFGYRTTGRSTAELRQVKNLVFAGFIALADGLRPSVPAAVRAARGAGIQVVMLTGDHAATATTIGRHSGILTTQQSAAPGSAVEGRSPDAIRAQVDTAPAFARVLPEHKYAILDAYHGRLITAMTGDGVNDVPALVKADVGIAVGRGSDAAKEAADIIILNNNFATIIEAIRQGRAILANVRKMLMYLFATTVGEVGTMIAALILGLPLPITAVQILWVNMVTDGFAVIPLGLEPQEAKQMKLPPVSPTAPLLSRRQLVRVGLSALAIIGLLIGVFVWYRHHQPLVAGTMTFASLVVIQWAHALVMRSEHENIIRTFRRPNWLLFGSLTAAAALQAVLLFSPLAGPFDVQHLAGAELAVLGLVFAAALVLGEVFRRLTVART